MGPLAAALGAFPPRPQPSARYPPLDLALCAIFTLQKATGRVFTSEEKAEIEQAQIKAYRWTFLLSGVTHPNFDKSLRELSAQGHERVSQLARAIA